MDEYFTSCMDEYILRRGVGTDSAKPKSSVAVIYCPCKVQTIVRKSFLSYLSLLLIVLHENNSKVLV